VYGIVFVSETILDFCIKDVPNDNLQLSPILTDPARNELGPIKFVEQFPKPKIGNGVIITYSNNQALSNNIAR
jgi:hypothetical protein